ncbi:MAG: hypothetical protein RQ751_06215, partial [Longimicrobiales bacterium]|nr:hypothetical protein [Longimicrobiales bacterium]
MYVDWLSRSHHLPRRAGVLVLVGLVTLACSDDEPVSPLADANPPLALAVVQEDAELFEAPSGTFTPAWGTATIRRGPAGIQAQVRV